METNKVYIVIQPTGSYEDYRTSIEKVYIDRSMAEQFMLERNDYIKRPAPIPIGDYERLNYGYDDANENLIGKENYTASDFDAMNEWIHDGYAEYGQCYIEEYDIIK